MGRFDMDRMNDMLVKHSKKTSELENQNENIEGEFIVKLKEIEGACVSMEQNIEKVKEEKEQAQADLIEAERQVMLWERHIILEKEMQEALDPAIGQVESTAMQKEIHRMELRHDQLKRRQEQMIMEMERAIHKRDAISLKYEPKAKKNKQASTAADLKRQIQSLKNNLRLCTQANADAEQKIGRMERDIGRLQETIEQAVRESTEMEKMVDDLRGAVQVNTVEKQRNLAQILRLQRMAKRFEEFSTGTGPSVAANVLSQLSEQQVMKNKIVDMVKVMHDAYPQLDMLWGEVYKWLGVPAP